MNDTAHPVPRHPVRKALLYVAMGAALAGGGIYAQHRWKVIDEAGAGAKAAYHQVAESVTPSGAWLTEKYVAMITSREQEGSYTLSKAAAAINAARPAAEVDKEAAERIATGEAFERNIATVITAADEARRSYLAERAIEAAPDRAAIVKKGYGMLETQQKRQLLDAATMEDIIGSADPAQRTYLAKQSLERLEDRRPVLGQAYKSMPEQEQRAFLGQMAMQAPIEARLEMGATLYSILTPEQRKATLTEMLDANPDRGAIMAEVVRRGAAQVSKGLYERLQRILKNGE